MLLEPSDWTYATGATGAVGIAFVAASGGAVYVADPAGTVHRLIFGGLGAGWSFGFRAPKGLKLPTIPRVLKPTIRGKSTAGAGSITDFPSGGAVFRAASRKGRELTLSDIRGGIMFVEGGLGLIGGGSGDAMLFGMNPVLLVAALSNPALSLLMVRAMQTAEGAMIFGGVNVGVQAGGGVAGLVGYMH